MAGWKYYDGAFGNSAARFKDTVGGVLIEARLYDMDGDAVSYTVLENRKVVVQDVVRASGLTMAAETKAWNLAKRRAELVICFGAEKIKQLARERKAAANVPVSA